jgi:hypothetical protein
MIKYSSILHINSRTELYKSTLFSVREEIYNNTQEEDAKWQKRISNANACVMWHLDSLSSCYLSADHIFCDW